MPQQRVNGVSLYYESQGEGTPLLFIPGLGGHAAETPYLAEAYSPHLRYLVYDNRGCGRSDKPDAEYTIPGFADDAAALLGALGIRDAIVYGSSMGGMVAQELALRHPARVRALILGCTTAGAVRGIQPAPDTIQAMVRNQSLTGDEALEAGWALGYSAPWIAANRDALFARSRAASQYAAPRESYMRQVIAAARHDTYDRLDQIACPVMILHGAADVMIPPGNAGLLAEHIRHAEVHILDGLGHGYNLEGRAIADALVLDFVRRVVSGEAPRKPREDARAAR